MALTIDLYKKFNKRTNSTKQPLGTAAKDSFSCSLKAPSSIINPVVDVAIVPVTPGTSDDPAEIGYNYAYIAEFGRYYFINDWQYNMGVWTATLSVDVLASFKTGIGALSKYVSRSASDYDLNIKDAYYPAKSPATKTITNVTSPLTTGGTSGTFILGLIGERPSANVPCVGGVCYYALTYSEMVEFVNYLMGSTLANIIKDDAAGLTESVTKAMMNPCEYVASCIWLPFTVSTPTPAIYVQPKIGWWNTSPLTTGCKALGSGGWDALTQEAIDSYVHTFTLPDHPQVARGNYLNAEPYSKYKFHFEPWGDIDIDGNVILTQLTRKVTYAIKVELITGMAALELWAGTSTGGLLLSRDVAQLGIPFPLAQIITEVQPMNLGTALGAVVAGAAYAATSGGTLMDVVTGTIDALNSYNSKPSVRGVPGSLIDYYGGKSGITGNDYKAQGPYIETTTFSLVNEDLVEVGRPLCQIRTLSTLSGYIECADAEHDVAALAGEKEKISAYLTGGFFYE